MKMDNGKNMLKHTFHSHTISMISTLSAHTVAHRDPLTILRCVFNSIGTQFTVYWHRLAPLSLRRTM